MISYILAVVVAVFMLAADQISKWIVASNMTIRETKPFIEGIIEFCYIKNPGGAWGFLSGNTWVLVSLTVVAMLICLALLIRHGYKNKLLFWSMCLILAGGIGNLIDRILRGGLVVDFLNFQFMKYPVFNIADISVCIGVGLLALYFVCDIIKDLRTRKKNTELEEDGKI